MCDLIRIDLIRTDSLSDLTRIDLRMLNKAPFILNKDNENFTDFFLFSILILCEMCNFVIINLLLYLNLKVAYVTVHSHMSRSFVAPRLTGSILDMRSYA